MLKEVKGMKMKWTRGNNSSRYAVVIWLSIFPLSALWAQTTGSIKGLITDPQGKALPQASVSLLGGDRVLAKATTDLDGQWRARGSNCRPQAD